MMPMGGQMEWASLAAMISAMCDVIRTGKDLYDNYFKERIDSPNIERDAEQLRLAFLTYSDVEAADIADRIENCRRNFVAEGSGERRRRCLCNVLNHVKEGNGGTLPNVDHWRAIYEQLGCEA